MRVFSQKERKTNSVSISNHQFAVTQILRGRINKEKIIDLSIALKGKNKFNDGFF